MWIIFTLSLIPVIILIVQNGISLKTASQTLFSKYLLKKHIGFSLEFAQVVHQIQVERSISCFHDSYRTDPFIIARLEDAYNLTDGAFARLSEWNLQTNPSKFMHKYTYQEDLRRFRAQINYFNFTDIMNYYTTDNEIFINWLLTELNNKYNSDSWTDVVAYHMLILGKEFLGIEKAIGTHFFTNGQLSIEELLWYKGSHEQAVTFMKKFALYSDVGKKFFDHYIDPVIEARIHDMRDQVMANYTDLYSYGQGIVWIDNLTTYADQLDMVNTAMADYISMKTDQEIIANRLDVVVGIIVLIVATAISGVVSGIICRIARSNQLVKVSLQEKTVHLETEQKRTEFLLSQMVPTKIAKQMQQSIVEPEYFKSVTVMFCEICDMDALMTKSTPYEFLALVNNVNDIYAKNIERYNVLKLASAENLIIVASGLQKNQYTGHTIAIANLAIDLLERVCQIEVAHNPEETVKLRIGINTGEVVAGLVDNKLPKYCLFGSTVTEAKHMMDTSLALKIQVTEVTHNALDNTKLFMLTQRDDMPQKNASIFQKTYWLCGKLNDSVNQFDLDNDIQNISET